MITPMDSHAPAKRERPLSPHLQVYKLPMTALMSILHRMTGAALAIGTILVIAILLSAATGEGAYNDVMGFVGSWFGMILLFGWSVALFYHTLNGIRHLIWDMGYLFKIKNAERAGFIVLGATAFLTIITWICALA